LLEVNDNEESSSDEQSILIN